MSYLANSKARWPSPMLQSRALCVSLAAGKQRNKAFPVGEKADQGGRNTCICMPLFASGFSASYKNYY